MRICFGRNVIVPHLILLALSCVFTQPGITEPRGTPQTYPSAGLVRSLAMRGRWQELEDLYRKSGPFRHPIREGDSHDVLSLLAELSGNSTLYGNALTGIRKCIEYGADPNALKGLPLWTAARIDNWQKITERLLRKGAKPNLETWGPGKPWKPEPWGTPLISAIEGKNPKNVALLLKYKADPNLPSEKGKRLPLAVAASSGEVEAITILIKAGAKVSAKNEVSGRTALHEAAASNQPSAIRVLLSAQASRSVKDKKGKTALSLARAAKAREAIRALGG